MSDEAVLLKELALLRLETHFVTGEGIVAQSSFPSWLQAASRHVGSLHVVLPLLRTSRHQSGSAAFVPRVSDRVYRLPDCRGYVRAFLALPVVLWRLLQLRRHVSTIVVRVPEHLNAVLLPLLWVLRFNVVIWLVADREEIRAAEQSRRKPTLLLRLAFGFAAATGHVERFFLKRARVVANGSALADKVSRLCADQTRICKVVSSSLRASDMPDIAQRESREFPPTVLYVGRLSAEKGVGDLLDAVPAIKRRCREARIAAPRFRLVGWGGHGEEERLRGQVDALRIAEDVEFCGRMSFGAELFSAYQSASLCVLPSWSEGTPRVLVEAMAFGLPVVATDVGGIPDVIVDGENGLLVPPRNADALAVAVGELLMNGALATRMSRENLSRARELSVENVCRRLLAFVAQTA